MLQLSPVIAGCMKWGLWGAKFSTPQYLQLIEDCLANYIFSFDHADIYGDYTVEVEFGNALKQKPLLRQQLQLITKCGIRRYTPNRPAHKINSYDSSKEHIILSAETSLKNFGTDYLDVLLIHRPDPLMHPQEIAAAFSALKQSGKVLHVGVSNFTPTQMEMMANVFPVEYNQLEISVLALEPFHNGTLDKCIQLQIKPMAWGPLGSGKLFRDPEDERNIRILSVATILAEKYNASTEQILLSFLYKHPSGIIPVMGSTKIERLITARDAAQIKIEREEWFMLWRASKGHEVP
ncbi:MAG TPA: aldo/keto reductase [Chitinophagaceae bacterium]|nr:aldo/keto reductase [Chitinophagaceae bacterium]